MRARRTATSVLVVGVLLLGLVGGWFAAQRLQSPAQVAARAAPPEASDVVARVTVGELTQQVTARSEVARESASSVNVALGGGEQNVVTGAGVPPDSELRACDVALEVNGRPVIATTGAFPYYRDVVEGDTGPDVEQLQRFLQSCGFRTGGVGQFGAQTARAVRQLYDAIGYDVVVREGSAASDVGATSGTAAGAGSSTATATATATGSAAAGGVADPAPTQPASPPRQLVVVPRAELVVLPSLPAVVGTTPGVGTVLTPENAVLTFGQGAVVARAKIAVTVLPTLAEGMAVTLTGADGTTKSGTLGPVPAAPAIAEGAAAEVAVPLVTEPIDETWLNANVLTTITVTAVADEALRVPSRSVAAHADGASVVQRKVGDGDFQEVEVRELGRLGGTSAVEPVTPGALSEGDEVKVE